MKVERCEKESFVVIGKEGSSLDGAGFIQKLWEDANSHFEEVKHLAKKDENGNIGGIWGAMSDFSRSFQPWEEFSRGFILQGWNAVTMRKLPKAGQSGSFLVMSIFMWNVKVMILLQRQ